MPEKEGFLMRNILSRTSSTALSGVDAPLVTPAMRNIVIIPLPGRPAEGSSCPADYRSGRLPVQHVQIAHIFQSLIGICMN